MTESEHAEQWLPLARKIAWDTVNRWQWVDFDDAYSDAMLGLVKAIRSHKANPQYERLNYPYLHKMITGECCHGARARARAIRRASAAVEHGRRFSHQHVDDTDARDWLTNLPERERQVATLSAAGFTQHEIGRAMGVHRSGICRSIARIKADWEALAA